MATATRIWALVLAALACVLAQGASTTSQQHALASASGPNCELLAMVCKHLDAQRCALRCAPQECLRTVQLACQPCQFISVCRPGQSTGLDFSDFSRMSGILSTTPTDECAAMIEDPSCSPPPVRGASAPCKYQCWPSACMRQRPSCPPCELTPLCPSSP